MELTSKDIPTEDDLSFEELKCLFHIYRLANLNARYYGCRAEGYERKTRRVLVMTGLMSALALGLLLCVDPTPKWAKIGAAIAAGLAAILTSVSPFFGWTEKARELRNLHFSYSQLFGQIEFVITEIRRANRLTEEHIGLSRMVHEAFMRIEALDELEPDQKLIDREDMKVRAAFPEDYLWTNF